jgi:hypothetical protein
MAKWKPVSSSKYGSGGRTPGAIPRLVVGVKNAPLPKDVRRFLASLPPRSPKDQFNDLVKLAEPVKADKPNPPRKNLHLVARDNLDHIPTSIRLVRGSAHADALIRRADEIARFACWERGRCQAKGVGGKCSGRFVWGHIRSRQIGPTRWHPLNCLCLCDGHEKLFHHEPLLFEKFLADQVPDRLLLLDRLAQELDTDPQYWIDWYSERGLDEPCPPALYDPCWRSKPRPTFNDVWSGRSQ